MRFCILKRVLIVKVVQPCHEINLRMTALDYAVKVRRKEWASVTCSLQSSLFINRNNKERFFFCFMFIISTITSDAEDRVVNYTAGFIVNACMYLYQY